MMQQPNKPTTNSQVKTPSQRLGKSAEDLAVDHLQNKGYTIVGRNYRCGKAEIDIIAQQGQWLCFVEVKARSNLEFGYPETFVKRYQQRLIKKAAENYIRAHDWNDSIRFDIIAIVQQGSSPDLVHFEDAFM